MCPRHRTVTSNTTAIRILLFISLALTLMIFQSENRNRANIYATLWMYCVWYFFVLHCAETMMISFGYSRQTFPDADDNDGLYYVEII